MTKTTTEDRDGFRITTVDYTASEDEHVFIAQAGETENVFMSIHFDDDCPEAPSSGLKYRFQWRSPGGEWDNERPAHADSLTEYRIYYPELQDRSFRVVITGIEIHEPPSFNRAIAETWPINWDWSDYYLKQAVRHGVEKAVKMLGLNGNVEGKGRFHTGGVVGRQRHIPTSYQLPVVRCPENHIEYFPYGAGDVRTLILVCVRQAADVVVGRVLSGKNPVPDDRQELVNQLFQAIQSWYTGNPPLYAAHVDPVFLGSNELRMLHIAQEFADVIIREAAP